jgi:hypothetical protein
MSDAAADQVARIAVLEEIARGTRAALERIERRMDGFTGLLGTMAHGFGWL